MYGVMGEVRIDPAQGDEAEAMLAETVIPMVKQAPGFVAGYWLRSDDGETGRSIMIFETEEAARKVADNIPTAPDGGPVTPVSFEVMRVVGSA